MPAPRERMRASDHDREVAADRLRVAAAEGRLSADELDDRLSRTFAAATFGELDTLTDDLPVSVATPPPPRRRRAGWWRRFGAWAIDAIVVGLITSILTHALHGAGFGLGALVSIAYFSGFEGGAHGAGAGKRALGIRVVDARTGGPIGYGRACGRWFGRILSAAVCFLGYLWMLWDPERQCWHDKLAGDLVVFSDGRPELPPADPRY